MDTPKLQVSWLECFPPDIWAYIVCYLTGEHLGRLMMTGATLLWRRLKSPHVVKSIKLGQDFMIFKSPPKFLNELPSLDELSIHSCHDEWSCKLGAKVSSIPSGVRKLELSGIWRSYATSLFVEGSFFSKHLPHLTSLDIMPICGSDSWMIHSPQSLTSLNLGYWDGSVALPSSLLHFQAGRVKLSTSSFVSTLPHLLESFVTRSSLDGVDLIVPILPPSTHKLHFERCSFGLDRTSWHTLYEQLPKFLTCFSVSEVYKINFETNPELISLLPTTLTELDLVPALPCSAWHLLPPNLTKLSFYASECWPTVEIVDSVGVQRKLNYIPVDLLPRSLTRLDVKTEGSRPPATYFCEPATTMSNQSYFPPDLTWLKLAANLHLSPKVVKLLPSSLTYLEITNLCEQVCQYLPTGLKTLITSYTLMSANLINFLPKSLTSLRLSICSAYTGWFEYNTGQRLDSIRKLPEYSIHAKCLSKKFDWKSSPLPSTLTHLDVRESSELGDSFLQHQRLPNLLKLSMSESGNLTDLFIPLLPRHLTTLDLSSSSHVSGKSFEFLPRCLIEVQLLSSESIFDSNIQHLPRTLKRLHLHEAIHLTDLCVVDLPPHLEKLDMRWNDKITTSSLPNFPHLLRSDTLFEAVLFKKWSISGGICRK